MFRFMNLPIIRAIIIMPPPPFLPPPPPPKPPPSFLAAKYKCSEILTTHYSVICSNKWPTFKIGGQTLLQRSLHVRREQRRQLDSEFSALQKLHEGSEASEALQHFGFPKRAGYLDQGYAIEQLDVPFLDGVLQQLLYDLPNDTHSVTRNRRILQVVRHARCWESRPRVLGVFRGGSVDRVDDPQRADHQRQTDM